MVASANLLLQNGLHLCQEAFIWSKISLINHSKPSKSKYTGEAWKGEDPGSHSFNYCSQMAFHCAREKVIQKPGWESTVITVQSMLGGPGFSQLDRYAFQVTMNQNSHCTRGPENGAETILKMLQKHIEMSVWPGM